MKRYGSELKFIGMINSDGLSIEEPNPELLEHLQRDQFDLRRLSISEETFIASNFHTFVVKLKNSSDETP